MNGWVSVALHSWGVMAVVIACPPSMHLSELLLYRQGEGEMGVNAQQPQGLLQGHI